MGIPVEQKQVKLVASIIFKEESCLHTAQESLEKIFGSFEPVEKVLPFEFTDYYYGELGRPLKRKLICFKKLVDPEGIAELKLKTNKIEDNMSIDRKRVLNIDPGYVTEAKLVLLTTKDYAHRVYVGRNIFAESTLYYQDGEFRSWPWTYPDYASQELRSYFNKVREIYMKDLHVNKT